MLKELVARNRSYRRFYQNERISEETLKEFVDLARMAGSTANSQALKYRLAADEETCSRIYPTLGWAGALKDWTGRRRASCGLHCDLVRSEHCKK